PYTPLFRSEVGTVAVDLDRRVGQLEREPDAAVRRRRREGRDGLPDQLAEVESLEVLTVVARVDVAEVHELVDLVLEPQRLLADRLDDRRLPVVERPERALRHHRREGLDARQRRPQL